MSKAISTEQAASKKRRTCSKQRWTIDFKEEIQSAHKDNPPPAALFCENSPSEIELAQPASPKMPILLSLFCCFLAAGLCWFVIFQIITPLRQAAALIAASENRILAMRKTFSAGNSARQARLAARKTYQPVHAIVLPESGVTVSVQEALQVEALMDEALRQAAGMLATGALKTTKTY